MKRMVSKIFCVIMALCVFLGAMPIASFAENGKPDGYVVVENVEFAESKNNNSNAVSNAAASTPNGDFMSVPDGIDEELPFN